MSASRAARIAFTIALLTTLSACGDGDSGASDEGSPGGTSGDTSVEGSQTGGAGGTTGGATTGGTTGGGTSATTGGATSATTTPEPDCLPSRAVYGDVTSPLIEEHCGQCHGDVPDFGAPYSLTLGYDDLVAGVEGSRKVDRMVARMANKTMPPPNIFVPHAELDTLAGWGSCGAVHPDESIGLQSTMPLWNAPANPPEDAEAVDLLAPDFSIGPDVLDLYQCFTFEMSELEGDRFIRRMEVLVDESRVLHHIVILRDTEKRAPLEPHVCANMPSGSDYLYAWAPGGKPIQFEDGGVRVTPGDRFIIQVHYNNGAGLDDIRDSSGIRMHLGAPVGTEYGMVAPGPLYFRVPSGETRTITGDCTVTEPMRILASAPHMHEIGSAFDQMIVRADGTEEPLISLTGWSFELQLYYDTPFTLEPGDKLVTSCTYDNPYDFTVQAGEGTQDEMCFSFMYVTPPPTSRYCDDANSGGLDNDLFVYSPGACFEDPTIELEIIGGTIREGDRPPMVGGELTDGHWSLVGYDMLLPDGVPIGEIDQEASRIQGAGQLRVDGDTLSLDVGVALGIVLDSGVAFDFDAAFSSTGAVSPGDAENKLSFARSCGTNLGEFWYEASPEQIVLSFTVTEGPIVTYPVLTFEPTDAP